MWANRGLQDSLLLGERCSNTDSDTFLSARRRERETAEGFELFNANRAVIESDVGEFEENWFPTTRFYGSKRRQLGWLRKELAGLKPHKALDAFGGTGATSYLFSRLGWRTTYNDIFEFNTVSARAIFSNSTSRFLEEDLRKFLSLVKPKDGFVSSTFDNLFYTQEENSWIDGYMELAQEISTPVQDLLLHCLFQACLKKRPFNLFHRANLKLRHSRIPVRFGNRTTWDKSFNEHILATYRELYKLQARSKTSVTVLPAGCAEEIAADYDLIYLDPPYFKEAKRNTETYLERYHFLEGLARYREWPDLIDKESKLQLIRRPYRNEWSDKKLLLEKLRQMIERHPGAKFVLSYVSDEEPTEMQLFNLFKDCFSKVKLSRHSFSKALSKKKSFEILLMGQ